MERKIRYSILIFGILVFSLFAQQGKYLLYTVEENNISNLVLLDTTTSETELLTHFKDQGKISSISVDDSGLKIIFTRPSPLNGKPNSTIWMVNYDGSGLTDLIEGDTEIDFKYAAISPDGTEIAFCANSVSVQSSYQLYVMDLEKKIPRKLTNFQPPVICSYPSFIDNDTILFKYENTLDGLQEFYTIDIDSTILNKITNNQQHSPYFPRLGRPILNYSKNTIIFAMQTQSITGFSNWEICSIDTSGGNFQTLIPSPPLTYGTIDPDDQQDPQPCFINGEQIAFIGTQNGINYDLYIADFSYPPVGNPYWERLTFNLNPELPYYFEIPVYPLKIAFTDVEGKIYIVEDIERTFIDYGHNPCLDRRGVYLAYSSDGIKLCRIPDGTITTLETDPSSNFPVFSPDGKWILYIKNNDIWGKPLGNSSSVQFTNSPDIEKQDLCFSPDGKYILYTAIVNGHKYIYKLNVSITYQPQTLIQPVGLPQNLTSDTYDNYHPAISEDGNTIVFISTRNQIPEIWKMNRKGQYQERINFDTSPQFPAYPQFSPVNPEVIGFLSGYAVKSLSTADLSADTITSASYPFQIKSEERFSWCIAKNETIDISRFIIYENIPADIPFRYRINLNIDKPLPESLIVEETIPETWLVEEVRINNEVKSGFVVINENGYKTVKLYFGPSGIDEVKDMVIELKVNLNGDSWSNEYLLHGKAIDSMGSYITYGDSFIKLAEPFIPVDLNKDWKISDEELLDAIDYWATNTQIHGWPENVENWDMFLLDLVDFWAGNGYRYCPTESQTEGEPRWEKI